MKEHIGNWIFKVIEQSEGDDQNILHGCGAMCAANSGMLGIVQESLKKNPYTHTGLESLAAYLDGYIYVDHPVEWKGDHFELTYAFEQCPCPVMNEYAVKDPKACACTVGFLKTVIGQLTEEPVEVDMLDSFIKNGKPCRFQIR